MLGTFVALYLVVTVAIGLWAARRVHNSKDSLYGRQMPQPHAAHSKGH